MRILYTLAAAALLLTACHSHKSDTTTQSVALGYGQPAVEETYADGLIASPPPRAQVFKLSDNDFANHVPVMLNDAGVLTAFPAPSDLTEPIAEHLYDNYWLDRYGITPSTHWLDLTVEQYKALPADSITPSFIKSHIAPGVRPVLIQRLPMAASDVTVAEADSLVREGLPDCPITYVLPGARPMK